MKDLIIFFLLVHLTFLTFSQTQVLKIDSITEHSKVFSKSPVRIESNTVSSSIQNSSKFDQDTTQSYPPKIRDYRKLRINTSLFFGAGVVVFGGSWILPQHFFKWDRNKVDEEGFIRVWYDNVKRGPVVDHDKWYFNYVIHPYAGAVYYMTARSCGFTWYESFGYSALMSAFFWEYGFEGLIQIPSIQDIVVTPTTGAIIGESFFYMKKKIMKHNKKVLNSKVLGLTMLFLLDPANTVVDFLGYKLKINSTLTVSKFSNISCNQKTFLGFNLATSF